MTAAVGAEVGCSALLLLGLATRFAALPLAFTMAVALFVFRAADPWQKQELSALFLTVYVTLVFTGGGRYSIDAMIARKRARAKV